MRPYLPSIDEMLAEMKRQKRTRWELAGKVAEATSLHITTPFKYLGGRYDCSTTCYRAIVAELWPNTRNKEN